MGISAADLSRRYPVLYHMASADSWPAIRKHGLLSTASLLSLFEVPVNRTKDLLRTQRCELETIFHPEHGTVVIRDQKPLSQARLDVCLLDCDAATWYSILNERVFFWLTQDRLKKLMSAKEYVNKPHTVLQVDTASVLSEHGESIELAAMNTGNTLPFAHPRGRKTFRSMSEYPYEERLKRSDYYAVVELTVLNGVSNLASHVIKVERAMMTSGTYKVLGTLYERGQGTN